MHRSGGTAGLVGTDLEAMAGTGTVASVMGDTVFDGADLGTAMEDIGGMGTRVTAMRGR